MKPSVPRANSVSASAELGVFISLTWPHNRWYRAFPFNVPFLFFLFFLAFHPVLLKCGKTYIWNEARYVYRHPPSTTSPQRETPSACEHGGQSQGGEAGEVQRLFWFCRWMPLQFNSAFNISVLSCSSSPIPVADTRTAGETEVYLSLLILQEFNFYTCTCLKFYLAVWGQPNSLGLRYVIHLEEASHLSLWPFSPLLMCRCRCMPGKRVVCWRLQQEDGGSTFIEGQKGTKLVNFKQKRPQNWRFSGWAFFV